MSHLLNYVNGFFLIKYIMMKLEKYKQNLAIQGNKVWSYTTNVATIEGNKLIQHGWWSVTTQKHINYVAKELDLTLIK